jgi:hypothetical protein
MRLSPDLLRRGDNAGSIARFRARLAGAIRPGTSLVRSDAPVGSALGVRRATVAHDSHAGVVAMDGAKE